MDKEIAELKAENETLKSQLDFEVQKKEVLEAENERLKSEVGKLTQTCGSLLNIQYALADSCKKYSETLQEIKTIADEDCEFCDDIGGCMDNECRKVRILDLITKAEEE